MSTRAVWHYAAPAAHNKLPIKNTFIRFTHSNAKKQNVPSSSLNVVSRTQGNVRLSRCAAGKNTHDVFILLMCAIWHHRVWPWKFWCITMCLLLLSRREFVSFQTTLKVCSHHYGCAIPLPTNYVRVLMQSAPFIYFRRRKWPQTELYTTKTSLIHNLKLHIMY